MAARAIDYLRLRLGASRRSPGASRLSKDFNPCLLFDVEILADFRHFGHGFQAFSRRLGNAFFKNIPSGVSTYIRLGLRSTGTC